MYVSQSLFSNNCKYYYASMCVLQFTRNYTMYENWDSLLKYYGEYMCENLLNFYQITGGVSHEDTL